MKKSSTKILVLIFSFLLLPLGIYSQTQSTDSSEQFLLKVSVELRGRAYPNECLQKENITIYADGKVIREDCQKTIIKTGSRELSPVRIEKRAKKDDVVKYIRLIEQSDFLKADKNYYFESERVAADIVTTIVYRNQNIEKQVVINNYKWGDAGIPKFLHIVMSQAKVIDFLAR